MCFSTATESHVTVVVKVAFTVAHVTVVVRLPLHGLATFRQKKLNVFIRKVLVAESCRFVVIAAVVTLHAGDCC